MAENKATQNPIFAKAVTAYFVDFFLVDSKGNYTEAPILSRAFDSNNKAKAYGLLVTLNAQQENGAGVYFKVVANLVENGSINFQYQDTFIDYELKTRAEYIENLYELLSELVKKARKNPTEDIVERLEDLERTTRKAIENYAKALSLLEKPAKVA